MQMLFFSENIEQPAEGIKRARRETTPGLNGIVKFSQRVLDSPASQLMLWTLTQYFHCGQGGVRFIANPRGNTCPVPVVGLVTNAMEEDKSEEVDPGQSMVNVDNKITLAITIKNSLC